MHNTNKEFISKIYKELLQSIRKRQPSYISHVWTTETEPVRYIVYCNRLAYVNIGDRESKEVQNF